MPEARTDAIAAGRYDVAIIATRRDSGQIDFQLLTGEAIGTDRVPGHPVGTRPGGTADGVKRHSVG